MPQTRPQTEQASLWGNDVEENLRIAFDSLPNKVQVMLFTEKGQNDVLNKAAMDLLRSFKKISDKIELSEFDLSGQEAKKWNVTSSPTLIFDADRYSIRYLGVPYGEEGRTLVGMILLLGFRTGNLSEQSRKVMEKIGSKREIKVFVSPTCPYCPDQAVNAVKAAIERPDIVSLEIIDIQSNQEIANRYSAFSVPQTFANDVLIAYGAQPEELFVLSLQKLEQQTVFIPETDAGIVETDVVIVGGGPSGLAAGIYAVRSGLKTSVIERGALGGQVATTPVVENYPGFTRVPGKTLVDILVSHALEYVQIFQGEEVLGVQPGPIIEVQTSRRKFLAKALILATGANYKKLEVPGEMHFMGRGVSYCATCDGPLFKGKKVIVVGGGNSAVTEALYLNNIDVWTTLVHRRDTLRAQEHLVKNIFSNNIEVLWDTEVVEIRGKEKVGEVLLRNITTGLVYPFPVQGVFIAIGYEPSVSLAKSLGIELTSDGFIKHDSNHRTNIAGIYSAGDVEGGYKQIVTAMGQGTEAALSVFEDLTHPYWTAGEESKSETAKR
ncbi:FAD-dependent pyridine nucleotide-disulphide oxidoreductase [Syntrophobacter sp. SbD1]|nr:FAD-dependent pyridine nucleotide-disulphide oxidoreductase [Syntrophobacter sp. SbD1]